ncbi:MAG: Rieske 2Fe-2S domain-containing protein [Aliidongia sp.]
MSGRCSRRSGERIFLRSWHLIGHVSEFREPGNFVTEELLDQSVLIMAGRDGEIRAFHNVCQHRGNRLVETRRGRTAVVTCGYHAWSYGLDGGLRGAPRTECLTNFDKGAHGLKPVRVETLGSFVFVNLDPAAESVADSVPGAEAEMRRFLPDLDRLKLIQEVDVPVAANWKVIQENSIEGYHFNYSGPVHKQLDQADRFRRLHADAAWQVVDLYRTAAGGHDRGLWRAARWRDLADRLVLQYRAVAERDDLCVSLCRCRRHLHHDPDRAGDLVAALRLLRAGRPRAAGCDQACIRWMNEDLGPEDIRLNISNQKGLRSLGYDHGRYLIGETPDSRSEHLVRHFHRLCYEAVRP